MQSPRIAKFILKIFLILVLVFSFHSSPSFSILDEESSVRDEKSSASDAKDQNVRLRSDDRQEIADTLRAPDRIIVKFKSPLIAQEIRNSIHNRSPLVTRDSILNQSLQKYAVSAEPLFKGLGNKTAVEKADELKRKFPMRAERAPDSVPIPALERTFVIETSPDTSIEEALAELRKNPNVEYAEPDYVRKAQMVPNDPYYSSSGSWGQPYDDLWGIKKLNPEPAWDISQGEGVVVAVIDTGADYNHQDIAQNIWTNLNEIPANNSDDDNNGFIDDIRGWDFVLCESLNTNGTCAQPPIPADNNPMDLHGHGTHVSGTIAAVGNNGVGVIGVAPQAKIMPVRGLNRQGRGLDSWLANAVYYAAENGADICNNSWGGYGSSQTLTDAFDYAYAIGMLSIAAAGNENINAYQASPANITSVAAVSATDYQDVKASFSNYGQIIDVSAPGVDVLSLRAAGTSMGTPLNSYYTRASGTSMATPHATGVAAVILSEYPNYTNIQIWERLNGTAEDIFTENPTYIDQLGTGRVELYNALSATVLNAYLHKMGQETDDEAFGDGDGTIEPGERIHLTIALFNKGGSATNVVGTIETSNPFVNIIQTQSDFGTLPFGQIIENQDDPFQVEFDAQTPRGSLISFTLNVTTSQGYSRGFELTIHLNQPVHLWDAFAQEGISSSTFTQPKVVDLDGDGSKEVISALRSVSMSANCASEIDQGIYVWDDTGSLKPGFPVSLNLLDNSSSCGYLSIVGIGDVHDANGLEIVAGTGRPQPYANSGAVYVISATGVILQQLGVGSGLAFSSAVLGNLDTDEKMEIVAAGQGFDTFRSKIFAWNGNGTSVSGWPVTPIQTNDTRPIDPVIADLDLDGANEIIAAAYPGNLNLTTQRVFAYRPDGTVKWVYNPAPLQFHISYTRMFAADVDGDQFLEVVLCAYSLNPMFLYFIILDHNGIHLHTWQTADYGRNASIGDLNQDGVMEIAYHTGNRVYVADYEGNLSPGFPRYIWESDPSGNTYYFLTHLGIADLDGDAFPDIYGMAHHEVGSGRMGDHHYTVFAFDRFGNTLVGFPYNLLNYSDFPPGIRSYGQEYSPTVCDMNDDGFTDIVTSKGWGRLEAFTVNQSNHPQFAYYPEYGANVRNTKVIQINLPPVLVAIDDQSILEGSTLAFQVTAVDLDEWDTLILAAINFPLGASFIDHGDGTGTFSWTPSFSQAGVYSVTFRATDLGGLFDEETVIITVNNVVYTLTVQTVGQGTVNLSPSQPPEGYDPGTLVTLTAVPANTRWIFDHWEGALSGNQNPSELTMNNSQNVTAVFRRRLIPTASLPVE